MYVPSRFTAAKRLSGSPSARLPLFQHMKTTKFLELLAALPDFVEDADYMSPGALQAIKGWPVYTAAACNKFMADNPADDKDLSNEEVEKYRDYSLLDVTTTLDEAVDTENYGFVDFDENHLTLWCAGDWQPPAEITIQEVDGELQVTSYTLFHSGFDTDDDPVYQKVLDTLVEIQQEKQNA